MQFSFSFYSHFVFSFIGYLCLGIYLCRGSWRNVVRAPLPLAVGFVVLGHVASSAGVFSIIGKLVLIAMSVASYFLRRRIVKFVPSPVRDGHNLFSLLVGAALFALTVQLHAVLFGVPVFQLVK
jgi:hypothetical protein